YPGFSKSQKIEVIPAVASGTVRVFRTFNVVLAPPHTTSVLMRVEYLTGDAKAYVSVTGRQRGSARYSKIAYVTAPTDWVMVSITELVNDIDSITISAGLEVSVDSGGVIYVQAAQ